MSARGSKDVKLVLGASPRVDLLPPEVADRKRGAALRRSIVIGVVGAIVLSGGVYAFASWQAIEASLAYNDAQAETAALLAEQNEFASVRTLTDQLTTIADAQRVGAATEIEWNALYNRVLQTVPGDMTIDSFSIESGSPVADMPTSAVPGRVPYAALATFNSVTENLASAQTWVVNMKNLPDYGLAIASSINSEEGIYKVTVQMLITEAAYSHRFAPEPAAADASAEESETE